uniref:F-box domain-containing protein n=1 Tax=Aegilops tauschii subsp. strangulata TaxID=200361 RepID=A0A453AS39_AEGTS
RRTNSRRWGPYHRAGQPAGSGAGAGAGAVDRLSALPDALLHHITSFLKAWEVVPTCVLARRWRHLWASAPCIDLRVRHSSFRDANPPEEFCDFVDSLFLHRDASASVDTLRLRSSDDYVGFDEKDTNAWIRTAISRKARVIHLVGHRKGIASLDRVPFVSCHLKILKLSYARLDDRILGQLSSSCKSLEEMDLKDCLVTGPGIVSTSLKTLIMLKCTFNWDFSITAPNLVLLRLITPSVRVPSFTNFGSLVTGTIILDDSLLCDDFGYISDDDNPGYIGDDGDFDKFGFGYGFPEGRYGHSHYKDNYDYGSDIDSDDNTYEYSEIANDAKYGYKGAKLSSQDGKYGGNSGRNYSKILGGHNMLESLSTATSLELLTDAGEVVLTRELKRCPTFSNLKTLSLGEWCMAADFDALILLLQHSPNIKRLFLQLKLNFGMRKALETGIKLERRSFTCKDLRMVKIKCSKDDGRVHTLAHMFSANGIPLQCIYVRRSGNAHLRGQKFMRELGKQELD